MYVSCLSPAKLLGNVPVASTTALRLIDRLCFSKANLSLLKSWAFMGDGTEPSRRWRSSCIAHQPSIFVHLLKTGSLS